MISNRSKAVACEARKIYDASLRHLLESEHFGKYVSIEPSSGQYFLGDSFDDAVHAAADALPGRLTFTLRIVHTAALHLGAIFK
jgi:hypothetical protein